MTANIPHMDDPNYYDQYFGNTNEHSPNEGDNFDVYMMEYVHIFGGDITIYPVSEYDVNRDQIFGEDVLRK